MKRKWRENEEMEREIHSQDFLILCLFPPSLSISYIKNCHILSQNVKYGTFVANVTKNLTYALWGNNSGSNTLRGSSASCAGLLSSILQVLVGQKTQCPVNSVSAMATSVETCLAFRLRRLRRLCPKTKESFESFDVTCLSSYWTGLGWLATFCKLCILCTIFVILQVVK